MEKQLIEEISDGVATLTFNRPDRLNALSTPIMEGFDVAHRASCAPLSWASTNAARRPQTNAH